MNCPCGKHTLEERGVNITTARFVVDAYRLEGDTLHYVDGVDDHPIDAFDDSYTCGCGRPLWAEMVAQLERLDRD